MTIRVALFCAFLFLIYAPTLGHGFHFDDFHMVANNQLIKNLGSFREILTSSSISTVPVGKGMYRPVLMASFLLNYQWGGLNPAGYHLINVWMHLLVFCGLVGLALRLWPGISPRWILLSAALWAVHPLHTQAVAYVSSGSSVLATLGMVFSLWLYMAFRDPGRSLKGAFALYLGSVFFYLLALGSKEIAITLPGLLLLVEWRIRRLAMAPGIRVEGLRGLSFLLLRISPFLLATAAYLLWRKILIGAVGVVHPVRPWDLNTRMQLEGILMYLRLWFWPVNQSLIHPEPEGSGFGPWIAFFLLIGLTGMAWRLRAKFPGGTFAYGWAGITFLPIAFVSSLNLVVAEHHAYLPSAGFALGLPLALQALSHFRFPIFNLRLVSWLLVGVLSVATIRRSAVWADDLSLWADAARKAPQSSRVQNNLGLEYQALGKVEEAFACYARAIKLAKDPLGESTARNNLGTLYLNAGQPEEGLAQFRRSQALRSSPDPESFNNMGLAYADLGNEEAAEEAFVRALDADPWYVPAYLNLGVLRIRQGRIPEAGFLFEQAIQRNPDDLFAHLALGKFHISQGNWKKATEAFQRFVRLAPRLPEGYLFLSIIALRGDPSQPEQARAYLAKAVQRGWQPDYPLLTEMEQLKED